MAVPKVPAVTAAAQIAGLLDAPEIAALVSELEATRWTGRPGYPIRSMVGMALAKSLYAIPTWTRTVALVREHTTLAAAVAPDGDAPSVYACYRFAAKLRAYDHLLTACLDRVTAALHDAHPEMGANVAIDGSDMPAYANGQRYLSRNGPERERYSDPDASWGHRSAVSTRKGGGYYGYKVHAAVCVVTGLPLAWTIETASAAETNFALGLIDAAKARGFSAKTAIMDKGYDNGPIHDGWLHGSPRLPSHAASQDACRGSWRSQAAVLRARRVDVRRDRLQAPRDEVALPHRRVQARLALGQGRPAAPADPARDGAVTQALPLARSRRARVRPVEARMGAASAARPWP